MAGLQPMRLGATRSAEKRARACQCFQPAFMETDATGRRSGAARALDHLGGTCEAADHALNRLTLVVAATTYLVDRPRRAVGTSRLRDATMRSKRDKKAERGTKALGRILVAAAASATMAVSGAAVAGPALAASPGLSLIHI